MSGASAAQKQAPAHAAQGVGPPLAASACNEQGDARGQKAEQGLPRLVYKSGKAGAEQGKEMGAVEGRRRQKQGRDQGHGAGDQQYLGHAGHGLHARQDQQEQHGQQIEDDGHVVRLHEDIPLHGQAEAKEGQPRRQDQPQYQWQPQGGAQDWPEAVQQQPAQVLRLEAGHGPAQEHHQQQAQQGAGGGGHIAQVPLGEGVPHVHGEDAGDERPQAHGAGALLEPESTEAQVHRAASPFISSWGRPWPCTSPRKNRSSRTTVLGA